MAPSPQNISASPLFSLVMPVYGVERYIADAIADVLTQDCGDFELIVVDDCTPDRSIEIAEYVAGGDARMRIVHHESNRGLSQARNTGIDAARGRWLLFPDPDDRYESDMLAKVRDAVDNCDTDLVVFGHVQEYHDASGKHLYDNALMLENAAYEQGPELGRAAVALERQTHLGYAWNKAYRTELVRTAGLRFEDNVPLIEDILFNVEYLKHARSVVTLSSVPYRYAKRLGANLTNDFVPRYFELHRRRIAEVRALASGYGALDEQAQATIGALYARYILSALERNADPRSNMTHAERINWVRKLFEDELFCELIPKAHAEDSAALAACLKLLNARNPKALVALGRTIHLVRNRSTVLYSKAKSKR
ncbi:MAG: glycosyltransferase family 2 protein [Eggerthellaceae bacterium]|nr:glycosyltransferase family 2 protein [Eggerthellaceae bacterium]